MNPWLDLIRRLMGKTPEAEDRKQALLLKVALEEHLYKYAQVFNMKVKRSEISICVKSVGNGNVSVTPNNKITNTVLIDFLGENHKFSMN